MDRCGKVVEEGKEDEGEDGEGTNGGLAGRRRTGEADQEEWKQLPRKSERLGSSGMQCLLVSGGDDQHSAAPWCCGQAAGQVLAVPHLQGRLVGWRGARWLWNGIPDSPSTDYISSRGYSYHHSHIYQRKAETKPSCHIPTARPSWPVPRCSIPRLFDLPIYRAGQSGCQVARFCHYSSIIIMHGAIACHGHHHRSKRIMP
ncbi:hypothetical protein IF1G_08413 [Cordyceps javanica]|uniref:Uncharacterized protein n=1 Tax=Cordyceps javanica TaxID=43265 RepID=A0A545UUH8_9HYPO|nr:hypothetical protein IF1G_08413 [Cordyceps javanica]